MPASVRREQQHRLCIEECDSKRRYLSLVARTYASYRRYILRIDLDSSARSTTHMFRYKVSALLAIPTLLAASLAFADAAPGVTSAPLADPAAVFTTKAALRDLWVEHVFWIRGYVVATHSGDAAQRKVAEAEVIANATALAGTVAPFYGQSASDGLLKLLAGHWQAVRDFNTATLAKSDAGQKEAIAQLTGNARELSKFLSGANPFLPEEAVFGLLSSHAGHHISQIEQIAAGHYQDEAETWAAMRGHMLVISDAIADALAKQFPEKFQERT
jgi:hypothetical protein